MLTIISAPRRIAVISYYLPALIQNARQLDGSWNPDFAAWFFRPSAISAVKSAVKRSYRQNPDEEYLYDEPGDYDTIAARAVALKQLPPPRSSTSRPAARGCPTVYCSTPDARGFGTAPAGNSPTGPPSYTATANSFPPEQLHLALPPP